MIFWEIIGAFIESATIPKQAPSYYIASWGGILILMAASSLATGSTIMLSYQTGGLSHLFRFSKLTPKYYLGSIYAGITISTLFIILIIIGTSYLFFGSKFSYAVAFPKNIGVIFITSILTGLFYTALSVNLSVISLKITRKLTTAIGFLPLMLSYLFGFAYLYLNLKQVVIGIPFSDISMLSFYGYTGKNPPLYLGVGDYTSSISTVPLLFPLISLITWIIILTITGMILIRNLYLKQLEEQRVM
jgi:hypothetical protein